MRWMFGCAAFLCWLGAGALLWWRVPALSAGFVVLGLLLEVASWALAAKASDR